jgi:hypothetical protein
MRTEFKTKFPCGHWKNGAFKEEGGTISYIVGSYVNKGESKLNLDGTAEIINGPIKGYKFTFECKDGKLKTTTTQKSEAEIDIDNKLKNFPCLSQGSDNWYLRKTDTNLGKMTIGAESTAGGYIWYNLDDSTYFCMGGQLDGEKGKFSCNGNELVYGDITQPGTTKTVTDRLTPLDWYKVTKDTPIIYGMRDSDDEGLINTIQY